MGKIINSKILSNQYDLSSASNSQLSPFLKRLSNTFCFIAIIVFLYVCYSSYKYAYYPENLNQIKLIRKEVTPFKVLPDNPGGEQFNNQDKFIYNTLENKKQRINSGISASLKEVGPSKTLVKEINDAPNKISDKVTIKKLVKPIQPNQTKPIPLEPSIKVQNNDREMHQEKSQNIKKSTSVNNNISSLQKNDSVFDVLQ